MKQLLFLRKFVTFFIASAVLYFELPSSGYAQYYNQTPGFLKANSIWVFGNNVGLDFNSGSPVGIQTAINGTEGFASVCDPKTGKLLFYSNGNRCWNANHQVMPNGSDLEGNGRAFKPLPTQGMLTTAQGTCIVPIVDSPGKYYLFSLIDRTQTAAYGLYYSIVDMSLDNGNGDIDKARKNILLNNNPLSEAMIAVPGDNCDIWLLLYGYTRPEFIAYHIAANGILDTVPVISNNTGSTDGIRYGTLTISPDRKKVVISDYTGNQGRRTIVTLGEFDAGTGIVSNTIEIGIDNNNSVKSTCFSPDNSKMYIAIVSSFANCSLYQYDVSTYDSTLIKNSETYIATLTASPSLRLYRDTIYLSNYNQGTLHRICKPNLRGTACDFQKDVVSLFPGTVSSSTTLPGEVVYPLSDTVFNRIDTLVCSEYNVQAVHANSGYSYSWNTGDTTSQIHISDQGQHTYWVIYGNGRCENYVDSFRIDLYDVFTTITVNQQYELGATGGPFASYQWFLNGEIISGATDSTYTLQENGDYQVVVTNEFGCTDTSDIYTITNYDVSVADVDAPINQIHVYPNPANDIIYINSPIATHIHISSIEGRDVLSAEHAKVIDVSNFAQGIYLLRITDSEGRLLKVEKVVKP